MPKKKGGCLQFIRIEIKQKDDIILFIDCCRAAKIDFYQFCTLKDS